MNPILQRELGQRLRSGRTLAVGLGYLALLGWIVWWLWPEQGVYSLSAQASRTLVLLFATAQTLAMLLLAPAFSAVAIVSEKEANSYDLLFASRLRPMDIVAGKLLAALAMLFIFLALSAPFFAACFLLGAVSAAEALKLYGLAALSAVAAGLIGLTISSRSRNSQSALIRSYLAVMAWALLPWVLHVVLFNRPGLAGLAYRLRALSPVSALVSVLLPGRAGWDAAAAGYRPAWQLFAFFASGLSVFLFARLAVEVHRIPRPPRRNEASVIDDRKAISRRRLRFPFYLVDPQRRRKPLSDFVNPVFAREVRGKAFGSGVWVVRAIYLCFALSAGLVLLLTGQIGGQSPDGIKAFTLAFQLGLVLLIGPALTSGTITQEVETRNIDLLRMSRIGPWALLSGKFQMALIFVVLLMVGSVPLWLVIGAMELNSTAELLRCWQVIGATILLALAAGFFGSAVSRRSAAAAGIAYAVLACVAIGTLAPAVMPGRLAEPVARRLTAMNPFLAAYSVLRTGLFETSGGAAAAHLRFSLAVSLVLLVFVYLRVRRLFLPER